jgi:predicted RNase H-like nuclease (RuvC/YqgF family)
LDWKEWTGVGIVTAIMTKVFGRKKDKADLKKVVVETDDIVISNLMKLFDVMKTEWVEAKKTIEKNKKEIEELLKRVSALEKENTELRAELKKMHDERP